MLERTMLRRLVTVPAVVVCFVILTALAPLALLMAVLADVIRQEGRKRSFVVTRLLAFAWTYVLGEVWAVLALGVVAVLGRKRSISPTYVLQSAWAAWNFRALRALFDLDVEVHGQNEVTPGPILVLSRHVSLIDTLLPAAFVVAPTGIRLKYVLKKELLVDPALDIAGKRLPNFFVDRGSTDSESERRSIRDLSQGLGDDEGVLIYPEGTRFSEEKRVKYSARFRNETGPMGEVVRRLRRVLPPRPGGVLAMLEASEADVLLLMHRGLEGLATLRQVFEGNLVGSKVEVQFRRIPRHEIPSERTERVEWLFELWAEVDRWVLVGEATS